MPLAFSAVIFWFRPAKKYGLNEAIRSEGWIKDAFVLPVTLILHFPQWILVK